jgi:hypothetical protein
LPVPPDLALAAVGGSGSRARQSRRPRLLPRRTSGNPSGALSACCPSPHGSIGHPASRRGTRRRLDLAPRRPSVLPCSPPPRRPSGAHASRPDRRTYLILAATAAAGVVALYLLSKQVAPLVAGRLPPTATPTVGPCPTLPGTWSHFRHCPHVNHSRRGGEPLSRPHREPPDHLHRRGQADQRGAPRRLVGHRRCRRRSLTVRPRRPTM